VKLLLDSCVWGGALGTLRAAGHDVIWSGDWPADPGDEEILAHALAEGRVLEAHGAELAAGAIITAEPSRLRVRPAGSKGPEYSA
jgi:predicted nuclease of predicted toxin-antitoxin system